MSTLAWITAGGIAMSALALSGSLTLLLPERWFDRVVPPLVALAAGTLLGGALLHLLPEAVVAMGGGLDVYVWLLAGFVTFFVLEQFLHWHHCHRPVTRHGPIGYLILVADGVHNFIGGLAVAGAFLVDVRVGLVTWAAAAAHEVPQELGDFGILVHAGWSKARALAFNLASAMTFLVGGWIALRALRSVRAHLAPALRGRELPLHRRRGPDPGTDRPSGGRLEAAAHGHLRSRAGDTPGGGSVGPYVTPVRGWRAAPSGGRASAPGPTPPGRGSASWRARSHRHVRS